ncbi:ParB/RepB/Spo0J family partition protein [Sphingomonas sp. GC_Shp_6]|uniref:ParB/RepB/Spo0J family partition protein n=2 Tax=unclassified Sphingomonas TaxID=196159 RepID=UPI00226A9CDD|nr:ParB/RepB/Spo0J family partition protein [Sphingomonas sp. GC_Shp_6]
MMASRFENLLDTVSLSLDTQSTSRQVIELPLDRISSDPNNPRRSFSDDELAEMAESIKAHGVLQPIVVRQVEGEQRYLIRFGDRRFRASALAGKTTIPAIVAEVGEEADDLVQQVVENDQRVDLTAGELAAAVAKLMKSGMKQAEIAKRLGRPKAMISMYAAVASMPSLLADLAATSAIRTVYELHQAWKIDAAFVEEFVSLRGADPITKAEAVALASAVKEKASAPPPPTPASESLSGQTPGKGAVEGGDEAGGSTKRPPSKRTLRDERGAPSFFVEVAGRRGRLVFADTVSVLFEGQNEPEAISASAIRPA